MMQKTAARLAAALSAAWKAKGASSALAEAITQRKAVTATRQPGRFHLTSWTWRWRAGSCGFSLKEHRARNHIRPRRELIEIKLCGFLLMWELRRQLQCPLPLRERAARTARQTRLGEGYFSANETL